jgi:hypothetical protein
MVETPDGPMLPQYFAPRKEAMDRQYGEGNWTPQEGQSVEVDPTNGLGMGYLRDEMDIFGGFPEGFLRDEGMLARNMTHLMRNYQKYVPEDDLALALAEIFEPAPGAVPGQTGSGTQTGQSDVGGSVGGANTPGATVGGMFSGGANAANVFGTVGLANFATGLYNSIAYGHYAGPGYGKLDKEGNVIPGTYKGGAGYSPGRSDFKGPGGQTGQAGTGSDGPSGGGGGIST